MNLFTTRAIMLGSLILSGLHLSGQSFSGSNPPGTFQDFPFTIGPAATNLAINLPGNTNGFSHLLLKKGAAPSDNDYDFIALASSSNAINLEIPEFVVTNYVLRVRTPTNSPTHNFVVTLSTNLTDIRGLARPATKQLATAVTSTITSNAWQYFRVDAPTNLPGWRIVLHSTNNTVNPDLYLQTNNVPSSTNYWKRSTAQNPDTLTFTNNEASTGPYFIGVFLPGTTNVVRYTLTLEFASIINLAWDPGTNHLGTQIYTNLSAVGGDYYFRVVPQNTAVGAWRTALNVSSGEAHAYLQKGVLPVPSTATYKSERVGSDGFVVPSTAFAAGEEWYLMVRATPGSQWNLVTGEAYVSSLGVVAADGSSGSGAVTVGAEGVRFFKTTVPATNVIAWRLWLNGLTNNVLVKKVSVPTPTVFDFSQSAQMLLVPTYLVGGQLYFVGVSGAPGQTINLDSRLHTVTDINFQSGTSLSVTGFPYASFRVQVPVDELAWQISVLVTNGNPNVAVRRNFTPNEFNNDAYSEVPGTVSDSISLVPPTLSDGTFYITVYGTNSYNCTLRSGPPVVTDIPFTGSITNDDPNRAGWRYYRITDIPPQLGALGWNLFLQNFTPGTRIGLRRNAVPSSWNTRNNGANSSVGFYEMLSAADFLQHPAHQADVWYVGVYNPGAALGSFTLVTEPLTAQTVSFDGGSQSRASIPVGKWQFFKFIVPANALGWDLRLTDVTNGAPRIVVRHDLLPTGLQTINTSSNVWTPGSSFTFPSGYQWKADLDWTRRAFAADGVVDETGRILAMGMGLPLEAGTYYVGVIDANGSNSMSYTLLSRGIGTNFSIPVTDLAYNGGTATTTLGVREAGYYRVQIPSNTPSWKVRLQATVGEVMLINLTNRIPSVDSGRGTYGKLMQKIDNEHYVLLPPVGKTNINPGTYYLTVIGEGFGATNTTRVGTSSSTYTLTSQGPLPITHLGTLTGGGVDITLPDTLEGGEVKAYTFLTSPDTRSFELRLEERVGNPVMVATFDEDLPDPGQGSVIVPPDAYGNEGGVPGTPAPDLITCANCEGSFISVVVKARGSGIVYSNASYNIRLHSVGVDPLAFDGGTANVPVQTWGTLRYWQVDVPANAFGWDIRVKDATGAGVPHLVINRGYLPNDWVTAFGGQPGSATSWPLAAQWAAGGDWTRRLFSATGVSENGRLLAMGMGRPLQPGTYFVGVQNDLGSGGGDTSYTISSRGIGPGFTIPVTDLDFNTGIATHTNLAPREAAYYRVQIPVGSPSWKVKVSANSAADFMLLVLSNSVPNVDSGRPSVVGKFMQKVGAEHYVLLPTNSPLQTALPGGTYYLAVVSEGGALTNANRIGVGNSSFTIQSLGAMPVADLGTVSVSSDLVYSNATQEGGETIGFQFSVPPGISSLEVRLENRIGNPVMVVRQGAQMPDPGGLYTGGSADDYGNQGGYTVLSGATNAGAGATLVTIPNPVPGPFSMVVKARSTGGVYANASYNVRVSALAYADMKFECSGVSITNQAPNTWRYFRFDIPATNILGWDIRVTGVSSNGNPRLVVRRDALPNSLQNSGWSQPGNNTNWASGNQWAANTDWTLRQTSASGVNENYRILAMGMGQPLEPGTYYAGVYNNGSATNLTYTIQSRAIGDGSGEVCNGAGQGQTALTVQDLPYSGGSITNTGLAPRQAAYYRIQIPANAPSLKLRVASTAGELMLLALPNRLPNVDSGRNAIPGKLMQKAGNEHYFLLPTAGQSFLTPQTLYLVVVSEGVNPPSGSVGIGSTSFVITSEGQVPVLNLGTVGAADLVQPDSLEGGESKVYQFTVPQGVALEARLENRIGNPTMVLRSGGLLPYPGQSGSGLSSDDYGNDGGQLSANLATNNIPLPSPTNGTYTLVVKARPVGASYPDADYIVRVRRVPVLDLNFSNEQNINGLTNVASGLLADNQRAYYRVSVPALNAGLPVIGWRLELAQSSGISSVRVRQNFLPDDALSLTLMPFTTATAIIAPPFLTNGTWYVEVRGSNSTAFTLTSRAVTVARPAWVMPGIGQPTSTPGLTYPNFGDTGLDTNGVPLPGDRGVDMAAGSYDFYSVTVPPTNNGVIRLQLTAISGNPDVYLRTNFVPTLSHRNDGQSGFLFDRSLASGVTEYGNFVPLSGRTEYELFPGNWYIAVRAAGNANARYRMRLSAGTIQNLSFTGGSATGIVAGSDWYYFKVKFPESAPTNWWVTFNQVVGDVVMYVRDTVPPGNGASKLDTDIRDWFVDNKNVGPYPNYVSPGTYLISTPQLRPGSVYYLGFKAVNDATFTVSNNVGSGTFPTYPTIDFYGGSVSNQLPGFSEVTYRIYAPRDATRWRHSAIHVTGVGLYLENGYLPTKTSSDDYRSTTANSSLNQYLLTGWPWEPNANYFLTITNTTASVQNYSFTMDGRNCATDDNDLDGMPDCWERQNFAGSTSPTANTDYDGDGVSNLNEYLEGTSPADPKSLRPRLTVTGTNGVVNVNPPGTNFSYGTPVSLTATANPGYVFVGWGGQSWITPFGYTNANFGTNSLLSLNLTNNLIVNALFRAPGDDFVQRIPINGWSNTVTAANTNATKEPGEPAHANNVGGHSLWWTWTALSSGTVTMSTLGSSFDTLLAVYTGTSISNLTAITANDNDGTNLTSIVHFSAVAGTTYVIAVDGAAGASGNVVLQVKYDIQPLILSSATLLPDGRFQFTLTAEAGFDYEIQATTNLANWVTIAVAPNPSGTIQFIDSNAPLYPQRLYRATRDLSGPVWRITGALRQGNEFTLLLTGPTGQVVRVEATTNFLDWQTFATLTNLTGSVQFTDPAATSANKFYRAVSP